jgi:hypothetical protein
MRKGSCIRRSGAVVAGVAMVAGVTATALPAHAQARTEVERRTIQIQVPVVSAMNFGPTRLIGLETPQALQPGVNMIQGALWANNLGASTGGLGNILAGANAGVIADFGVMQGLQMQVQAGLAGAGQGAASVMGKYNMLNEAYGGSPLSLGILARVHGMLPSLSNIMQASLAGANLGVSFGVPVSKAITDRLTVLAVPGLSFIGSSAGLVTTGNLGLGADFAITDRFRALVDANIGVPSAGIIAVPAGNAFSAGLRYSFSDAFTSDLYLGVGGIGAVTGLTLPISVPSLGLAAAYRF